MEPNQSVPAEEVERMMKLQDIILKATAKKISWLSAAEIIGITLRSMRRWRERLESEGYDGLRDRRKGKVSQKRVPLTTCEQVLQLYQEKYFDFNVKHFHEKLEEEHGIQLSYSWVKQALQGAGYVARKKKRGPHRRRRPRKEMPGIMLHIDGSKHASFQDDRYYDFIVVLDDANTEIYYAQLVEEESTVTCMAAVNSVPTICQLPSLIPQMMYPKRPPCSAAALESAEMYSPIWPGSALFSLNSIHSVSFGFREEFFEQDLCSAASICLLAETQ